MYCVFVLYMYCTYTVNEGQGLQCTVCYTIIQRLYINVQYIMHVVHTYCTIGARHFDPNLPNSTQLIPKHMPGAVIAPTQSNQKIFPLHPVPVLTSCSPTLTLNISAPRHQWNSYSSAQFVTVSSYRDQ